MSIILNALFLYHMLFPCFLILRYTYCLFSHRFDDCCNSFFVLGTAPIGFFEFITNPNSFAQTIENLFHLSFLVKVCPR